VAQRPAVLVPTLMADAHSWAQVVDALPGRVLLPVELPGHGLRRNEDFSFAEAVNGTLRALDQVSDGSAVHLVGSGLGAAVVLSAALAEPTRVQSVLVAGFVPARGTSGDERLLVTKAALTRLGVDAFVEEYLNDVLGAGGDDVRSQLTAAMSTVRAEVILQALGSAVTWRLAAWPRSGPPAGVIHASQDIRVSEPMARGFALELRGEIIRLIGPGHLAYLEEPGPFAEAMNRFHALTERAAGDRGDSNGYEAPPVRSDGEQRGEQV